MSYKKQILKIILLLCSFLWSHNDNQLWVSSTKNKEINLTFQLPDDFNNNDYISKAIKFSSNIKELSNIRKNLRNKALNSPIFDCKIFADDFDKLLWGIWKKNNPKD